MSEKITLEDLRSAIREEVKAAVKESGALEPLRKTVPAIEERKESKELFGEFLRAALFGVNPTSEAVRKALGESSDPAGGYLVPDEYRGELIKRLPGLSELFPYARKLPVASDSGRMPRLATDITLSWDEAESAAFEETEPSFGSLSWNIHRANAMTKVSRELMTDSAPKIADVITDLFVEAMAQECDKMIAVGDGSTQPEGLFSAASVVSVSVGTMSFVKLVEVKFTLAKKYRRRARWVMNNTNVRRVQSLVDNNNQPLFRRDLSAGAPPTLLGYPVGQQDDLPDDTVFFGDLSYYLWFDREQVGLDSTTVGGEAFAKHQLWLKTWMRVDGKLALPEAFVKGDNISG